MFGFVCATLATVCIVAVIFAMAIALRWKDMSRSQVGALAMSIVGLLISFASLVVAMLTHLMAHP